MFVFSIFRFLDFVVVFMKKMRHKNSTLHNAPSSHELDIVWETFIRFENRSASATSLWQRVTEVMHLHCDTEYSFRAVPKRSARDYRAIILGMLGPGAAAAPIVFGRNYASQK